jgi:hypothetical protein
MLKAAKLTSGIGARIAHNILCISTADALTLLDHVLASVANAKKRKTTKPARRKDLTPRGKIHYFKKSARAFI